MDVITSNNSGFWDSLAKPCSHYERRSAYADEFIRKSGIMEGETVLDMGCGSGTLCLPLADDGHQVFCGDFSPMMLKSVNDTVADEGISLITTMLLSWQDDWEAMKVPVCDVAFASRCMFDAEPADAVAKLSRHARRRVCITLPVNSACFKNPDARYEIGEKSDRIDYLTEIILEVFKQGYYPEISYMSGHEKGKARGWAFISWDK